MSDTFYKARNIIRQSLPLLIVLVILEIIAGQFLNNETLLLSSGILMLIPVLNGIGGNLGSILAARLTSALHMGTIEASYKNKELRKNILLIFLLGISIFLLMGMIIFIITPMFEFSSELPIWKLAVIFLGSGLLLLTVLTTVCVFSVFISYKKGIDPDNVVIPIVTTIGDFIGIISIFTLYMIIR